MARMDDSALIAYRPTWGRAFGVIAALVLAQLDYWLARATKQHDGHRWVFKTYAELADELGVTRDQTRRAVTALRRRGVVIAIRNPFLGFDRTPWYRIDRERLERALASGNRATAIPRDHGGEVPTFPQHRV
jgi:hypothetical protein